MTQETTRITTTLTTGIDLPCIATAVPDFMSPGSIRAVLETAMEPTAEGEPAAVPRVRLSLLAPSGDVACRVEVDDAGEPRLYVGRPGAGVTAVLSRDALDLWAGGNVVASVRAWAEGGVIELGDGAGRVTCRLPRTR